MRWGENARNCPKSPVFGGSPPHLWGSRSDFRIQMISTLPPKARLFLKPRTPSEAKSTDTRATAPWADGRTDASLQNGFRKSGFQKIYLRAKGGHVFTPSALPGRPSTLTENLSDPHRNEGGRRRNIGFFGDLRRFYPTSFLEGRSDWVLFNKIFSDSKISN